MGERFYGGDKTLPAAPAADFGAVFTDYSANKRNSSDKMTASRDKSAPPENTEFKKALETIKKNDDLVGTLAQTWLDLAGKADSPESKKQADKALTELADHLVKHKANPSRKATNSFSNFTMSDNKGWATAWTAAVEADPKNFSLVNQLAEKYNERAETAKFPGRVELKLKEVKDGAAVLGVRRFDPRGQSDEPNALAPDNFTLRYYLKPEDRK